MSLDNNRRLSGEASNVKEKLSIKTNPFLFFPYYVTFSLYFFVMKIRNDVLHAQVLKPVYF